MGAAVNGAVAGLQLQAVVVKIIDIAINFHQAALKLACIGRIIPCPVFLNPTGPHDLVGAKEKPVVLIVDPVVGAVVAGTPLVFHSL